MMPVIFSMAVSLDGYIAGPDGSIDFAAPDTELMSLHNAQSRQLTAHLTGRRLYEDMLPWETEVSQRRDLASAEFADIWSAIPKIVFSTTLHEIHGNARLATGSAAAEIALLQADDADGVISVGGAQFAATLIEQDLIDEYRLFVNPVVVGGGTPYFPVSTGRLPLDLQEHRTFGSGVVYLRYRRLRDA